MSTSPKSIGIPDALFNKTKQAILGLLFSNVDNEYHQRGIAKLLNISPGVIQRELKVLTMTGIILREKRGNQVFYRVNKDCPIYNELHNLVIKTVGLSDKLREALAPLADKIYAAFIYGSFARGSETVESDVDLMIIGELTLRDVVKALGKVREAIGRELNPSVFSLREYQDKLANANHFLRSIASEPKVFLIGENDDVRKLG